MAIQKTVLESAKQMGYVPNNWAGNLRTGKSNSLAISWHSRGPHNSSESVSNLCDEAYRYGYKPYVADHVVDM